MDIPEERGLLRVHERLATLSEKIASLQEHKAGAAELQRIEQGVRDADFRTLQEVSGLISNMRADVKDWIQASREENALKLSAAQSDIMSAIKADRGWQRQIPTWIAIALGGMAIITGNPHLLAFLRPA